LGRVIIWARKPTNYHLKISIRANLLLNKSPFLSIEQLLLLKTSKIYRRKEKIIRSIPSEIKNLKKNRYLSTIDIIRKRKEQTVVIISDAKNDHDYTFTLSWLIRPRIYLVYWIALNSFH
jgi:hypothetical protein